MEPKTPPSSAVLTLIENAVSDDLIDRLGLYALSVVAQLSWRGVKGGAMPCGDEAQDLVAEGLSLVLSGDRQWNPEKHPDFRKYMMDVIDSLASHRTGWKENREERRILAQTGESDDSFLDRKMDKRHFDATNAPITKEEETENDAWFFALLDEVKGDTLLTGVLECIMEGIGERIKIAEKLGVMVGEVTNARKRLDRIIPKFRENYAHLKP